MPDALLLPFDLPAVRRKKLTVDFEGGKQSSNGGALLLRESEVMSVCAVGPRARCRTTAISKRGSPV